MPPRTTILAVDDEELSLDVMRHFIVKAGYDVVVADCGEAGLELLEKTPGIDGIVLDRLMPDIDGLEFLQRIRASARFRDIPVIMQTGAAGSDQVLQGIQAGVYYYLTKPYEAVMLLAVLGAAVRAGRTRREMVEEVSRQRRMAALMEEATFQFRTLQDAKTLAFYISSCFPEPEKTVFGLNELLINAVEHGNLGIGYAEKTGLVLNGDWIKEVERRLAAPENRGKAGRLWFKASPEAVTIRIKDRGRGFDWQRYLELAPSRATDPNGRGIAASRVLSFDSIQYVGDGSEVVCQVFLNKARTAP